MRSWPTRSGSERPASVVATQSAAVLGDGESDGAAADDGAVDGAAEGVSEGVAEAAIGAGGE
jgi:hypothetical protein